MTARKEDLDQAAALVAAQIEALLDSASEEGDSITEDIRGENAEEIGRVDWQSLTPEMILDHPSMRKLLAAHVKGVVDHMTYMGDAGGTAE